jgi:HEAT repeat protein
LSAVALRAIGPQAVAAIPGLVKALDDPSAYVRALAADSLGNIGPGAKGTVPVLVARLQAPGEQVFVMRSIAAALGNIGSAEALQVLQEAMKMPRVIYTAEEAIHKIKHEPLKTWY